MKTYDERPEICPKCYGNINKSPKYCKRDRASDDEKLEWQCSRCGYIEYTYTADYDVGEILK